MMNTFYREKYICKVSACFFENMYFLSYIYLGYFVCMCVCVCVSQFVAECSAILLVLVIKLTKETRRRVWRGRDRDGEIWKGTDREGGCV
jgi:hypothetical protein